VNKTPTNQTIAIDLLFTPASFERPSGDFPSRIVNRSVGSSYRRTRRR